MYGKLFTNEELIEISAAIRNHGEYYQQKKYFGCNFRMTEAQAAFGRVQLKNYTSQNSTINLTA